MTTTTDPLARLAEIAARRAELDREEEELIRERNGIFRDTKGVYTTAAILKASGVSPATYWEAVKE